MTTAPGEEPTADQAASSASEQGPPEPGSDQAPTPEPAAEQVTPAEASAAAAPAEASAAAEPAPASPPDPPAVAQPIPEQQPAPGADPAASATPAASGKKADTKKLGRIGRGRRQRGGGGPQTYDFRRPTKLSREHARTLQIVFEAFARGYSTQLTSTLRAVGQVNLLSVEQLTYDEYIASLNNPTVMNLLSIDPLPGVGVFELSLSSAMSMVDYLLGGPGSTNQPERPLSDIEMVLLRELLVRGLRELKSAFDSGVMAIEPEIANVEYNPQFAQAASASEMVLVATFEQKIAEAESLITICLPFNPLFSKLETAAGHAVTSERERLARLNARQAMTRRLEDVPVEVAVRFTPTAVPSGELSDLQVGHVLPLRHALNAPLAVSAADVTFAYAVPGSQGKRLAVLVVDPPQEENLR